LQCSPAGGYRNRVCARTGLKPRTDTNPVTPVRGAAKLAHAAVTAAHSQQITLPGQEPAARIVARLATGVIALNAEIAELDR
jgi:hypothetical protein